MKMENGLSLDDSQSGCFETYGPTKKKRGDGFADKWSIADG